MSAVINRYVTVKKTRGDVLSPAAFRSIVEMIRGIVREQGVDDFNETYLNFLEHIADHNDPHQVTNADFFDEIVDEVYRVYSLMLPDPISREDFDVEILPTVGFLELCKRIVMNRWVYDSVKNPDGTVPSSVTISLSKLWGIQNTGSVTVSFGSVLSDETAFILRGWSGPTTPISIVFNALNLQPDEFMGNTIFHTSQTAQYDLPNVSDFGYPISLTSSSNDYELKFYIKGSPVISKVLFSMMTIDDTIEFIMSPTKYVSVKLNGSVVMTDKLCPDGKFSVSMNRSGSLSVTTYNNTVKQTFVSNLDFSEIVPFTLGLVGIPVVSELSNDFGFREFTVFAKEIENSPEVVVVPVMNYLPSSGILPITGSVSGSTISPSILTIPGYNLYLTLSGTWVGSIAIEKSINNGVSWTDLTSYDGTPTGIYTTNCDESVIVVNSLNTRYRLVFTISSGTVSYRLGQ